MTNFKDKTTDQLKVIAYDLNSAIQSYNQILINVNNEIAKRAEQELTAKAQKPIEKTVVEKPTHIEAE